MQRTIVKCKDKIQLYLTSKKDEDYEDLMRLLVLDGSEFFAHLAAIKIALSYQLAIEYWIFKGLNNIEDQEEDLVFIFLLLIELMPMISTPEISQIPNLKNFKTFFYKMKNEKFWTRGVKVFQSKSHYLDIQNYIDFSLMSSKTYDSFISNTQFRVEILINYEALKIESRIDAGSNSGYLLLYNLMLISFFFDSHNHLFTSSFIESKELPMSSRAESFFDLFNFLLK